MVKDPRLTHNTFPLQQGQTTNGKGSTSSLVSRWRGPDPARHDAARCSEDGRTEHGLSLAFSNGISLFSGIFQRIVTFIIYCHWNCPVDFQRHLPMECAARDQPVPLVRPSSRAPSRASTRTKPTAPVKILIILLIIMIIMIILIMMISD